MNDSTGPRGMIPGAVFILQRAAHRGSLVGCRWDERLRVRLREGHPSFQGCWVAKLETNARRMTSYLPRRDQKSRSWPCGFSQLPQPSIVRRVRVLTREGVL